MWIRSAGNWRGIVKRRHAKHWSGHGHAAIVLLTTVTGTTGAGGWGIASEGGAELCGVDQSEAAEERVNSVGGRVDGRVV